MIAENFDSIDLNRIKLLLENETFESKTLEFKEQIFVDSADQKKEFLYDISAFANTVGGIIVIGITENKETGTAKEIKGIEGNMDNLIRKLENILRDGIFQRISSIQFKTIALPDGKNLLLIKIPKSWNSPHQVIFSGVDKFYARNNNGKYKMDLTEIRQAFINSESLIERIQNFRADRISKIISGDTLVHLEKYGKISLHLIPLTAFEPQKQYDVTFKKLGNTRVAPLGLTSRGMNYNFDGIISESSEEYNGLGFKGYVQIFKNGIIETVDSSILKPYEDARPIPSYDSISRGMNYEYHIITTVSEYFDVLKQLNIDLPLLLFITFINIRGYTIDVNSTSLLRKNDFKTIDRDVLQLPEIFIDNLDIDISEKLKPLFDTVWNACGMEKSHNYDSNGKWKFK